MITIYTQPGCARSRRLRRMLKENNLPYKEEPLFALLMETDLLSSLLCDPSSAYRLAAFDEDLKDLTERIEFLQCNPSQLNRPVVFAGDCDEDSFRHLQYYLQRSENMECPAGCPARDICHGARARDRAVLIRQDKHDQTFHEQYPSSDDQVCTN